jgi:hypothetical protein
MRAKGEVTAAIGAALLLWGAAAQAASPRGVSASSEGTGDDGHRHAAALAFDGLLATGWAEGDLGDGAGSWLEVRFPQPVDIHAISLFPGWLGGANREIREFGRPKLVTLTVETAGGERVVRQERLLDPGERGPLRHDVFIEAPGARSLRITVDEAFSGGLHSDTFIAEVAVNLTAGGEPVASVADVYEWLRSDAGQQAAAEQRAQAITVFDQIQAADFGDRDGLRTLMDWAADGAPYLRAKVGSVAPGWRVQALQPDKTSIEALLKLKDSNAIPAIERASLRVTGALAKDLQHRAKLFDAHQELLGGGGRNAAPWGAPGIARGALQGFGAPLDVAVDSYGGVYVADTGNNRVQRFAIETGVVEQVWGAPEGDVTDVWLAGTREPYASGAAPGKEPGQFVNPVDLAVVPGKDGDGLLVLDGAGRITHIDPAGEVAHVQEVSGEIGISEGEGHVLYNKGKVVVVFGNEGFVFKLSDWSELGRFDLQDGVPSSAVLFKNGKLGLVYGSQLILYSTDGFRHGDLLGDSLGIGYEDWAVALDEKGKLWAALDTGEVVKFKRPGMVDYKVPIAQYSIKTPRIAAFSDHVFVSTEDHVIHEDAYELHMKADTGLSSSGQLDLGDD